MMLLPDIADLPIPKRGEIRLRKSRDIRTFVVYRSFAGTVETRQQMKQGAFARAAFADDRDLVACFNLQIELPEDDKIEFARAVNLRELFYPNERAGVQAPV